MAAVKKEDIPEIAKFMSDFWTIVKQFWITEESAEYWKEMLQTCSDCCNKYDNNDFVADTLIGFMNYQDHKHKAERNKVG